MAIGGWATAFRQSPTRGSPRQGARADSSNIMRVCMSIFFHSRGILTDLQDDVINTLIASLTSLSRMQRRPAFGSVFLLNNTAYLCANLLKPRAPVLEILSRPTQDTINSN